jgi:hemerythrin-like domain-containing protein
MDTSTDAVRQAFESRCYPSFDGTGAYKLRRNHQTGEYLNPVLEDHWNTFQEGWECAEEYLARQKVES